MLVVTICSTVMTRMSSFCGEHFQCVGRHRFMSLHKEGWGWGLGVGAGGGSWGWGLGVGAGGAGGAGGGGGGWGGWGWGGAISSC